MKRKIKPAAWNFPGRPVGAGAHIECGSHFQDARWLPFPGRQAGARKEAGYQLAVRRDAEKAQRVVRARKA